ncbi:copper resistance CopC family protein [Marinomonas fungiae]|uniref:copper resistance CopC family protein n=1 Tax=Marinomonas fungiae TaxID=1137284 RepID=UPI003A8DADB3
MKAVKLTLAAVAIAVSAGAMAESSDHGMNHGEMDHASMPNVAMSHDGMASMMHSTYPEDGAMMMAPVEYLSLHFTQPMQVMNVRLVGSDGKPVALKYKRGGEAMQEFMINLPKLEPDTYQVHWKAKGQDGHMMDGAYGFMQH